MSHDLFSHGTPTQEPAASLTDYICDLFVRKLTDAELSKRRASGAYRGIRADYIKEYHAMARAG